MTNLVRSIAVLALVLAACLPRAAFALDSGDIVVESVRGEVHVTMNGAAAAVRAGAVLELPATVDTGRDGAIELRQGATTVSVGPQTRLEFPALEKRGAPIDRIVQPRGNAFYNIGKREGRRLRVETPYLVGVIKGTQFNVAAQDEATTISLFEGLLEVRASDDSAVIDLKAGEIASRKRGDKSISVIKMDSGKAPPTQRGPAGPSGSNGGNSAPGSTRPAPVVSGDPLFADRGQNPGSAVAAAPLAEPLRSPADAGIDVDVRGNESGANLAAGVQVNAATLNVDVAANVAVGDGVAVDAGVAASLGAAAVDVGAAVDLNSSGVSAAVNAGVNLGSAVDAGVDAAVNVGGGAVDVGVAASIDAGPAAVDVGAAANVDLGAGAVDVAANAAIDAGPLVTEVNAGAAVDVAPGNVAANVDLGANADVGGVAVVDAGAGAAVDLGNNVAANVDVGANVAGIGAAVTTGVDVAAGNVDLGVNVAGIELNVGLDLGLGKDSTTDTTTPTTTPTPPVIDVGGLLDGLLRRPGRK